VAKTFPEEWVKIRMKKKNKGSKCTEKLKKEGKGKKGKQTCRTKKRSLEEENRKGESDKIKGNKR
jgi:hypothetical protein